MYAILISASSLSFAVGPIQTVEYMLPETIADDWESYKSDIEVLDSIYRGENQPEPLRERPPMQIIVDSIATRT
ncbi:hypothetical protein ACMAY4_04275 [Porticoccaceae bacterium nBUS_17]